MEPAVAVVLVRDASTSLVTAGVDSLDLIDPARYARDDGLLAAQPCPYLVRISCSRGAQCDVTVRKTTPREDQRPRRPRSMMWAAASISAAGRSRSPKTPSSATMTMASTSTSPNPRGRRKREICRRPQSSGGA